MKHGQNGDQLIGNTSSVTGVQVVEMLARLLLRTGLLGKQAAHGASPCKHAPGVGQLLAAAQRRQGRRGVLCGRALRGGNRINAATLKLTFLLLQCCKAGW
jgi:hypothetical protein